VEAALVVVDAVSGVEVVTERIWHYYDRVALPRVIVCTRTDRERADFNRVMESLTAAFGRTVVPVQLPIGSEKSFTGIVDLVKMQAYSYEMGGNGKSTVGPIPGHMEEQAKAAHERLVELVAEGDDALMESSTKARSPKSTSSPDCTMPSAKTRSSPCSSPPVWATSAPTKYSTSSWITCRQRSSVAR
jgi:translation elongation factor EF-G